MTMISWPNTLHAKATTDYQWDIKLELISPFCENYTYQYSKAIYELDIQLLSQLVSIVTDYFIVSI